MSGHYVGKSCECQFEFPSVDDVSQVRATIKRPGSNIEELLKVERGPGKSIVISFIPEKSGDHWLGLSISGGTVSGSPFQIPVEEAPNQNTTGVPLSLGLELIGVNLPDDFRKLSAKLKRPNERHPTDDLELELQPDNTVAMTFIPYESGQHLVYIYKSGHEVEGCPFNVEAKGPKPADPSKVIVIGDGIKRGITSQLSKFTIDARDAGDGGLGFSVEGPSKAELNCISKDDGTCQVEFLPKTPGTYTIHIKYADQHIPGSPFTCRVAGLDGKLPPEEDAPRKINTSPADISRREFIVESSIPVSKTLPPPSQRPHGLEVDLTGYVVTQLSANVETPTGKVEDAEIVKSARDKYTVTFITRNGGTHKVNVRYRNKHIPGSPFLVDVDTANWQLTSKCKVTGPKKHTGHVGIQCEYVLSTKESGGGELGVTVEGPRSTEIRCEPLSKNEYRIVFVPKEPGSYVMHMRFADQDIFKSVVDVTAEKMPTGVTQLTTADVKVGERFRLQLLGVPGQMTAYVITPSGKKIPAEITKVDKDNCDVAFTPEEPGEYSIHVQLAGKPYAGSPFKLIVGAQHIDPSKIRLYGPGLKNATAGIETSFTVDAKDAGPGTLSIDAAGPAKLDVSCQEADVGTYIVTYTPTVSGKYEVNVIFGGVDVPGSPFTIQVAPDPHGSKAHMCTPSGSGLHGGVQGRPNPFMVNCSKAGRGSLLVGVEGPVIPVNEIIIRHDGNGVFLVDYSLEEPGNYILKVLWGDEHIQGSPFPVRVERSG